MLLMDFEFILVSFFFEWAYRLTYFTEFAQIILIGSRITLSSTRNEKALKELYYLGVYLVMFILFYCFWKRDNIVPYVSIFSQNIKIWK